MQEQTESNPEGQVMKLNLIMLGLLSMLWLSGCGQKGDLYKSADAPPPAMEETRGEKDK